MTTNKPEVVGYIDEQEFIQRVGHAPFLHPTPNRGYTVPLIRISEYEARMAVLFDGHAVYSAMTDKAKQHTSPESVAVVLDAVVKLMREVKHDNQ